MQKVLIPLALALGLLAAYVDALPNWDDTAILAFGLLLGTGALGLLGFRRPWLLGLLTGMWIPLHNILVHGNYPSLIALVFAFAGAYLGWGVNRLVRKTFNAV